MASRNPGPAPQGLPRPVVVNNIVTTEHHARTSRGPRLCRTPRVRRCHVPGDPVRRAMLAVLEASSRSACSIVHIVVGKKSAAWVDTVTRSVDPRQYDDVPGLLFGHRRRTSRSSCAGPRSVVELGLPRSSSMSAGMDRIQLPCHELRPITSGRLRTSPVDLRRAAEHEPRVGPETLRQAGDRPSLRVRDHVTVGAPTHAEPASGLARAR